MKKEKTGKLIVFSAPSGSGKTTILSHLLSCIEELSFSISATSRQIREGEKDGKDYYYISAKDFREKINSGEFLEWEEVYEDNYYGTLKKEVERIWNMGKHVIFDVDVVGGMRIKQEYPEETLSIFVKVPSIEELRMRLEKRATESTEDIEKRISKAEEEMQHMGKFDYVLTNEILSNAQKEAEKIVNNFIHK